MHVRVTEDCISCGKCVDICPEVFQMGGQYAEVQLDPVPQEYEQPVRQAADECPTSAIIVE
jgi:ferredoxin